MLKDPALRVVQQHAAPAAVGRLFHEQAQALEHLHQRTAGRDQLQQPLFAGQQRFGAPGVVSFYALQEIPIVRGARVSVLHAL